MAQREASPGRAEASDAGDASLAGGLAGRSLDRFNRLIGYSPLGRSRGVPTAGIAEQARALAAPSYSVGKPMKRHEQDHDGDAVGPGPDHGPVRSVAGRLALHDGGAEADGVRCSRELGCIAADPFCDTRV